MSHVWDHAQWIPGKILPHFDPSHLSVGQLARKDCITSSTTKWNTPTLNSRSSAPIGRNDPDPFSTAPATKTLTSTF